MAKNAELPFTGTAEQEAELLKVIESYRGERGALVAVLQEAQEIYGYLPEEVQRVISDQMDIPMSEIYGVITFYTQFSLKPKGKYRVSVCLGTACYVKGSGSIYEEVKKQLNLEEGECTPDGKFSVHNTRCIGACGLAPVLTVNDEVYGRLSTENVSKVVKDILDRYK